MIDYKYNPINRMTHYYQLLLYFTKYANYA